MPAVPGIFAQPGTSFVRGVQSFLEQFYRFIPLSSLQKLFENEQAVYCIFGVIFGDLSSADCVCGVYASAVHSRAVPNQPRDDWQ